MMSLLLAGEQVLVKCRLWLLSIAQFLVVLEFLMGLVILGRSPRVEVLVVVLGIRLTRPEFLEVDEVSKGPLVVGLKE